MEHWRHCARAVLAVVASEIQRFPNFQEHISKSALVLGLCFASPSNLHVSLSWTPPSDRAAVVASYVYRNTSLGQPCRFGKSDSAVDFEAILVLRYRCCVAKVFSAKTFIAMISWEHSLALAIDFSLKLTNC